MDKTELKELRLIAYALMGPEKQKIADDILAGFKLSAREEYADDWDAGMVAGVLAGVAFGSGKDSTAFKSLFGKATTGDGDV